MTLSFSMKFLPITLESLTANLRSISDSPKEEAKEYLSFYQELASVLAKDEVYLSEMERSSLIDSFGDGYFDNFDEGDFLSDDDCTDEHATASYIERHFDELSASAQEQYRKLEDEVEDYWFLTPLEGHLSLKYEILNK